MKKYSIYGKLTALPGKRDELLGIMNRVSKEMEKFEECYCYVLGFKSDDVDSIYIYEVWEDKKAHDESLKEEVFRNLINEAMPIVAGAEDIHTLEIKGGKSVPFSQQ